MQHLQKVFKEKNSYPNWVITQIMEQVKIQRCETVLLAIAELQQETTPSNEENSHLLILLYAEVHGDQLTKSMKRLLKTLLLSSNVKPKIVYTGRKLSSRFTIKDQTNI